MIKQDLFYTKFSYIHEGKVVLSVSLLKTVTGEDQINSIEILKLTMYHFLFPEDITP